MKFVCDKCNTKYSISDEKVRRKVLKIRCKNCGHIIVVRDPTRSRTGEARRSGGARALDQALDVFGNRKAWRRLVQNGMSQDFSWQRRVGEYLKLYRDLTEPGA